jgi:hypothetical protein
MEPQIHLMIGGAAKAGTTSLLNYLGQHPDVVTHSRRELGYFAVDLIYNRGFEDIFTEYYPDGIESDQILAAKSVMLLYSGKAMERLRKHNPLVEIALILRNPIERAYSDFHHMRRKGLEPIEDFSEAVWEDPARFGEDWERRIEGDYLSKGLYFRHIQNLLEYFPREQVHIFLFEDFVDDPLSICQQIYRWFPFLDSTFAPNIETRYNRAAVARSTFMARLTNSRLYGAGLKQVVRNILGRKRASDVASYLRSLNEKNIQPMPIDSETRAALAQYYQESNVALEAMLGCDLPHWH